MKQYQALEVLHNRTLLSLVLKLLQYSQQETDSIMCLSLEGDRQDKDREGVKKDKRENDFI